MMFYPELNPMSLFPSPTPHTYREQRKCLRPLLPYLNELRLDRDKTFAKEVASSLGIRVPKTLRGAEGLSFVSKPNGLSGSRGVIVVVDGVVRMGSRLAGVLEEVVVDENGQIPPRDFKVYCFGYQPRIIQVIERHPRSYAYYLPDDWSAVRGICRRRWRDQPRPACLEELIHIGRTLSRRFHFPVRIDCYASREGAVFGEFCLTSGISSALTRAADRMFGEWWREHFEALGIRNEFDPLESPQAFHTLPSPEDLAVKVT